MFAPAVMVSQSGDLPADVWSKITAFSHAFFEALVKQPRPIPLRLLTPRDVFVALDPQNVHFVISGAPSRSQVTLIGRDFRATGLLALPELIGGIAHELAWPNPMGFSIPAEAILTERWTPSLIQFVDDYIKFEVQQAERAQRQVRINPIFRARDLLINEQLCFVLMPFSNDQHLQEIYADHVKPAIESVGLECRRADDIYDTSLIVENIWENIVRSRLLIAELTGRNPNVFYELGIAHTVGKEVILLAQNMNDVPFDLRHLRVIIYETTPRGINGLEKQLKATISTVLARPAF